VDHTHRNVVTVAAAISAVTLPPANTLAQTRVPAGHQATTGAGTDRELFSVRSADGTVLAAEEKGDPAAPEVLFVHGLR
jgi:non-heme chloroperoxidase